MRVLLFRLMQIIIYSSLINKSFQWTTTCDNQGKCEITYSINNQSNTKVYIKPGYLAKYPDKGSLITKAWNKTDEQIHISKQIDGISPYGLLKGNKQYECSGGLSECLNSCCLNGFCVEILYYCNQQRENIDQIYIITCTAFLFVIGIYWVTFFVLGWNYNKRVDKCEAKSKKHHIKAKSIPKDFAYNQSSSQIEGDTSRLDSVSNDNSDRKINTSSSNNDNTNNNENKPLNLMRNRNKMHMNYKSYINQSNNNQISDKGDNEYLANLRKTSSYKENTNNKVIQIKQKKNI